MLVKVDSTYWISSGGRLSVNTSRIWGRARKVGDSTRVDSSRHDSSWLKSTRLIGSIVAGELAKNLARIWVRVGKVGDSSRAVTTRLGKCRLDLFGREEKDHVLK